MRVTITIADSLMSEALRVSGCKTKTETVEKALQLLITIKKQSEIRAQRGKLVWEGDLKKMRTDQ